MNFTLGLDTNVDEDVVKGTIIDYRAYTKTHTIYNNLESGGTLVRPKRNNYEFKITKTSVKTIFRNIFISHLQELSLINTYASVTNLLLPTIWTHHSTNY